MPSLQCLSTNEERQWLGVLDALEVYDSYYLPWYHRISEQRAEAEAALFVYTEGDYIIALPLILQCLARAPELADLGGAWKDATSVYGYAGPAASQADLPPSVISNFHRALHRALVDRSVISVFSRLHPFLAQERLLTGLGEVVSRGQTVSIDLTLPAEEQRKRYRRDHRKGIEKLERLGVRFLHDTEFRHLSSFVRTYHETMRRVEASDHYFYDQSWFEALTRSMPNHVHLFVCLLDGEITCGGMYLSCQRFLQSYLSGSIDRHRKLATEKLLIDGVRLWANRSGAQVLHLGGGVSAQPDSLFEFKAGFSDRRHTFATWHWIVLPEIYQRVTRLTGERDNTRTEAALMTSYFPAYRRPTTDRVP